jgi:hypothetical protein
VNKTFLASGRLEVTVVKAWEHRAVATQHDTSRSTLEDQLPALIRTLETIEAEAEWDRKQEERRAGIREERWEEVKKQAFAKLSYQRNAERLTDELARRDTAAALRRYADEITARAAEPAHPGGAAAREWAGWIRGHADRTDPLNGPLQVTEVTSCSYAELEPHMNGWSAYHPYRH